MTIEDREKLYSMFYSMRDSKTKKNTLKNISLMIDWIN